MAKHFQILKIGGIEQGRLENDLNLEFAEVQRKLCAYVEKWSDKSLGARAVLTLKISLAVDDVQDGIYSVKSEISCKIPSRPPRMTQAISEEDEHGNTHLFGRVSGTTADDPRQGILATDDGRVIDSKTGKPVAVDSDGVIQE